MKNFSLMAAAVLAAAQLAVLSPVAAQSPSAPVFEALGGQPGLQKIVDDFVKLIVADPRIADTFRDSDLKRLNKMLYEQFCSLSGGPCVYSGKDMEVIHADLKVTNAQFNAIAEDLQIVMEKHNVPTAAANKLVGKLAPMQKTIVTK